MHSSLVTLIVLTLNMEYNFTIITWQGHVLLTPTCLYRSEKQIFQFRNWLLFHVASSLTMGYAYTIQDKTTRLWTNDEDNTLDLLKHICPFRKGKKKFKFKNWLLFHISYLDLLN